MSPPARPTKAHHQRSDVCAVPAAGIVAEAMVALVLADAVAEKFGGDSVTETRAQCAGLPRQPGHPVSGQAAGARWSSWSGPWASGRPPSGGLLAERLGTTFRDTDTDIVATAGKEISEIFIDEGEPHFRELERQAVRAAVAEHRRRARAGRRRRPRRGHPRAARRPPGGLPGDGRRRGRQAHRPRRRRARCSRSTRASAGAS